MSETLSDIEIAQILHESREYLESSGWVTDTNRDSRGRVCALGAVLFSQNWQDQDDGDLDTAFQDETKQVCLAVYKAAHPDVDQRLFALSDLTRWNDNAVKSKQEVLDAFAKAEKITRAGFDPDAV